MTVQAASAQAAPPAGDEQNKPVTSEGQKMEEARQRYQRGLQLFNESNYEAARVEFERAYQLAPTFKILYNIGLCYEQLGDYVQAQLTLRRFLDLGGSEITPERKAEVEKELAQIGPRIANARIQLNVDGAEIFVDDICAVDRQTATATCGEIAGRTREVVLNPGRRRITVKKTGYLPDTQVVTVAGSDQVEIKIDLKPLPKGAAVKETNPYMLPMIVGWSVTAAAGVTSIITGVLATNASDDQLALVNRFGAKRSDIDSAKDKTETLGNVTDGVLIGTGVAAAVSTYFTVRALGWKGSASETNVHVGLGTVGLQGRF